MGFIASPLLRLAILAIFAGVCLLSGFVAGIRIESDHRDAKDLAQAKAVAEQVRVVQVHDVVIDKTFSARLAKLEATQQTVMAEVLKHATSIPDPLECYLDPERVRVIADAWRGSTGPDRGAGSKPVSGAAGADVGKPPEGGGVGRPSWFRLPKVFGTARPADSEGAGAAGNAAEK